MLLNRRGFLKAFGVGAAGLPPSLRAALRGESAEAASIKFWDMRVGPASYPQAAQKLVDTYNAQHSGVRVGYELEEWTDWPQLFAIAINMGVAPDVSTGGPYQAVQYYEKGEVLDIDDVVADLRRGGEAKDFFPGALESVIHEGHSVGLPWSVEPRVIIYRKDLFAKSGVAVPQTWDELRATAKALTSGGRYGLIVPGKGPVVTFPLFQLILNNGGGLFTSHGRLDVMNERNVEAMTFFSNLVKDGSLDPKCGQYGRDEGRQAFLDGRGLILFDFNGLHKEQPNQAEKIGLFPPPIGPHGDKGTLLRPNNLMVYRQSKNPDAAKAFIKWWSANEKPLWTEGLCSPLPVRTSIASDPYFQSDPITKRVFEEWIPVGKTTGTHVTGIFGALDKIDGEGPFEALGYDLLAGKDPVESMRTAEERLKALLAHSN